MRTVLDCNSRKKYFYLFNLLLLSSLLSQLQNESNTLSLILSKLFELRLLNAFVFFWNTFFFKVRTVEINGRKKGMHEEKEKRSTTILWKMP